jgi:hypothetical protein
MLARTDDDVYAARLHRAHPVSGRERADYRYRVLQEEGQPTLVCGIGFETDGSDVSYVELVAWDRPLIDMRAWNQVLRRLMRAFAGFRPARIHVRMPGHRVPRVPRQRRKVDQWLMSGRLDALRARGKPWGWAAIDVRQVHELSFYDELSAAFASWQQSVGPRGHDVRLASREQLAECLETGAVVCAYADGVWAGVGAAARGEERLTYGYEILCFFLDVPLRRRRRAPILQRHLIDALVDRGRDALFGTIDGSNTPSLRAAQRCGRDVVETWWWLWPDHV